jgi:hypothetical protein
MIFGRRALGIEILSVDEEFRRLFDMQANALVGIGLVALCFVTLTSTG